MHGYFDESIIVIDDRKYIFLGFIVFAEKQTENIIINEFSRTKSLLKHRKEIKYTSVRDSKIKAIILKKIKSESFYYETSYAELTDNTNIHLLVTQLILDFIHKFSTINNKAKISLFYDRVSYKINFKLITNTFKKIKDFNWANSKREIAIQYADWIVGEASEYFRQQKNRH